ncbi:MAG: hypothetical protein IPM29_04290 [Planctomycetes bacterium]|nr:hypothetical protein [Planctomycetota bacterium]
MTIDITPQATGSRGTTTLQVTLNRDAKVDAFDVRVQVGYGIDALATAGARRMLAPPDLELIGGDTGATLEGDAWRVRLATSSAQLSFRWSHEQTLTAHHPQLAGQREFPGVTLYARAEHATDAASSHEAFERDVVLGQQTGVLTVEAIERPASANGPEDPIRVSGVYADRFRKADGTDDDTDLLRIDLLEVLVPATNSVDPPLRFAVAPSTFTVARTPRNTPNAYGEAYEYPFELTFTPLDNVPPGRYASDDRMQIGIRYSELAAEASRVPSGTALEQRTATGEAGADLDVGALPVVSNIEINRAAYDPLQPTFRLPIRFDVENESSYSTPLRIGFEVRFDPSSGESFTCELVDAAGTIPADGLVVQRNQQLSAYIVWNAVRDVGYGIRRDDPDQGLDGRIEITPSLLGWSTGSTGLAPVPGVAGRSDVVQLDTSVFLAEPDPLTAGRRAIRRTQITASDQRVRDNLIVLRGSDLIGTRVDRQELRRTRDIVYTATLPAPSSEERFLGANQSYATLARFLPAGGQFSNNLNTFVQDVASLDLNADGPDALALLGSNTQYVAWRSTSATGDPLAGTAIAAHGQPFSFLAGGSNAEFDAVRIRAIALGDAQNRAVLGTILTRFTRPNSRGNFDVPFERFDIGIAQPTGDPLTTPWRVTQETFSLASAVGDLGDSDQHRHVPALVAGEFDGDPQTLEVLIGASGSERRDLNPGTRSFMHLVQYGYDTASGQWRITPRSTFFRWLPVPPMLESDDEYLAEWRIVRVGSLVHPGHDDALLVRYLRQVRRVGGVAQPADGGDRPARVQMFRLANHGDGLGLPYFESGQLHHGTGWERFTEDLVPGADPAPNPDQGIPDVGLPPTSVWDNSGSAGTVRMQLYDVEVHDLDGDGFLELFLIFAGARGRNTTDPRAELFGLMTTSTVRGIRWRRLIDLQEVAFGPNEDVKGRAALLDLVDVNGDDELDFLFKLEPLPAGSSTEIGGELFALVSSRSGVAGGTSTPEVAGSTSTSRRQIESNGRPAALDLTGDGVTDVFANGRFLAGRVEGADDYAEIAFSLIGSGAAWATSPAVGYVAEQVTDRSGAGGPRATTSVDLLAFGRKNNLATIERQRLDYDPATNALQRGATVTVLSGGDDIVDVFTILARPTDLHRWLGVVRRTTAGQHRLELLQPDASGAYTLARTVADVRCAAALRIGTVGDDHTPPWRDAAPELLIVASGNDNRIRVHDPNRGAPGFDLVESLWMGATQANQERVFGMIAGQFVGAQHDDVLVLTRAAETGTNQDRIRAFALMQTVSATQPLQKLSDTGDINRPVMQYYETSAAPSPIGAGNPYAQANAESVLVGPGTARFITPVDVGTQTAPRIRLRVARSELAGITPAEVVVLDVDGDAFTEVFLTQQANADLLQIDRGFKR